MPTPDLPVELWLEILSYLPRSMLRKTVGVNRTLFEMAFNDIYEEVRLIADDKEMLKTFKQLSSHQNISQRVRFLLIRPAFLPGIDEVFSEGPGSPSNPVSLQYFKNLIRKPTDAVMSNEHLQDPAYLVLEAAKRGINACMNLREIKIVIHDHNLTPAFRDFYDSIWTRNSLGCRLQKLAIETTKAKLPTLLEPITANANILNNLCDLSIMLGPTRFNPSPLEVHATKKALEKFLQKFKSQLTSLAFSSSTDIGFSEMLQLKPQFPALRSISLSVVFNKRNYSESFGPLFAFIQNSPVLQKLEIKSKPPNISILGGPDSHYGLWLVGPIADNFQTLQLPTLKVLHLDIPEAVFSKYALFGPKKAALLSSIRNVAPNLESLVLEGECHSPADTTSMVDGLTVKNTPSTLTNLEFFCGTLTPQTFDLLAARLPSLRSLTIHPATIGIGMDTGIQARPAFYNAMESRRYNSWWLEKIRITSISYSCDMKMNHPDHDAMRRIAACFPKRIIVDNQYLCDCMDIY